jgi:hypothetical protein
MSKLHDFLEEHAIDNPHFDYLLITTCLEVPISQDCSRVDVTLVQKLCHTLKNIFGDTLIAADTTSRLLARHGPRLIIDEDGVVNQM